MRFLSVIPAFGAGGAEVVAGVLAIDARRRGLDVGLASGGGFRVAALEAAGVPHLTIPLDSRRPTDLLRTVRALRSAYRDGRPDLVHAHNVKAALVARLAFGRATPVLTTLHGIPAAELATGARILRWSSDVVVAVSSYVAAQLEVYGVPGDRLRVVENTIEPLAEHPRDDARRRLGIAPEATVVLCLARFAAQKRHDLLIEAWASLGEGDRTLLLAGDGPTRPEVQAMIARHGVAGSVRVLGERPDADWLLAAADVLVLPTDWEGLPISLLEAMGAGVPVLVSRVGGVLETLGSAVRLVEPGSATALADGLDALITDPAERAQLGRRGEKLVRTRFGAERMLEAYASLYGEVTGAATPAAGRGGGAR